MDVGEVPPDDLVHLRVPGQHLNGGVSGDGYRIEDVEPEARRAGLSAARIPATAPTIRMTISWAAGRANVLPVLEEDVTAWAVAQPSTAR